MAPARVAGGEGRWCMGLVVSGSVWEGRRMCDECAAKTCARARRPGVARAYVSLASSHVSHMRLLVSLRPCSSRPGSGRSCRGEVWGVPPGGRVAHSEGGLTGFKCTARGRGVCREVVEWRWRRTKDGEMCVVVAGVAPYPAAQRHLPRRFLPPPLLLGAPRSRLDPEEQRQVSLRPRFCCFRVLRPIKGCVTLDQTSSPSIRPLTHTTIALATIAH